jgi:hypothetical protein
MDNSNSEIKRLIIMGTSQTLGLITLWGLTLYFDKLTEPEIPICSIKLFGRKLTVTNKFFYNITIFTSSIPIITNFRLLTKEFYKV